MAFLGCTVLSGIPCAAFALAFQLSLIRDTALSWRRRRAKAARPSRRRHSARVGRTATGARPIPVSGSTVEHAALPFGDVGHAGIVGWPSAAGTFCFFAARIRIARNIRPLPVAAQQAAALRGFVGMARLSDATCAAGIRLAHARIRITVRSRSLPVAVLILADCLRLSRHTGLSVATCPRRGVTRIWRAADAWSLKDSSIFLAF